MHPSNFEIRGFTESVGVAELATLGPPVVADVGSGALVPVEDEPRARDALRDRGGTRDLLRGQASRRAAGRHRRRVCHAGSPRCAATPWPAPCAPTSSASPPSKRPWPPIWKARRRRSCLPSGCSARRSRRSRSGPGVWLEELAEVASWASTVDVAPSVARSGGGTLPTHEIPSFAVRWAVRYRPRGAGGSGCARRTRQWSAGCATGGLWLDARTLLPGDGEAIVGGRRGLRWLSRRTADLAHHRDRRARGPRQDHARALHDRHGHGPPRGRAPPGHLHRARLRRTRAAGRPPGQPRGRARPRAVRKEHGLRRDGRGRLLARRRRRRRRHAPDAGAPRRPAGARRRAGGRGVDQDRRRGRRDGRARPPWTWRSFSNRPA